MTIHKGTEEEISLLFEDVEPAKVHLGLLVDGQDAGIAVAEDLFDSEMLHLKIARVLNAHASSTRTFQRLYAELAIKLRDMGFDQLIRRVSVENVSEIWA